MQSLVVIRRCGQLMPIPDGNVHLDGVADEYKTSEWMRCYFKNMLPPRARENVVQLVLR